MDRRGFIQGCMAVFAAIKLPIPVKGANSDEGYHVILQANKPTLTGHIYPLEALENCLKDFVPNTMFGRICYPGQQLSTLIRLGNVSHMVEDLKIENDCLLAKIKVLETPHGLLLKDMAKVKPPRFITFGLGHANEYNIIDSKSYSLVTIDADFGSLEVENPIKNMNPLGEQNPIIYIHNS